MKLLEKEANQARKYGSTKEGALGDVNLKKESSQSVMTCVELPETFRLHKN